MHVISIVKTTYRILYSSSQQTRTVLANPQIDWIANSFPRQRRGKSTCYGRDLYAVYDKNLRKTLNYLRSSAAYGVARVPSMVEIFRGAVLAT